VIYLFMFKVSPGMQLVFSMFVLEALVLTCATTPIVSFLYPPHLRTRAAATGSPFGNIREHKDKESGTGNPVFDVKQNDDGVWKRRFTVVLDKLEHLPSMMAITQLLQPPPPAYAQAESSTTNQSTSKEAEAHFGALRLIELADRPSDVMKSSATDALLHTDPLLGIFRTFAELNGLSVSAALSIVPFDALAYSVGEHVRARDTQLVLVPWLPSAQAPEITEAGMVQDGSPFDPLFRTDHSTSLVHSHFVRGIFAHADTNVALLICRAPFGVHEQTHLFLPFVGGPDDRLALDFVVQLCANLRVRATVVRITKRDISVDVSPPESPHLRAEETAQATGATITSVSNSSAHIQHPFLLVVDKVLCASDRVGDGLSGHHVWQGDDPDQAAVRDSRRCHVGEVHYQAIFWICGDGRPHAERGTVARHVRGACEPYPATRRAASRAHAKTASDRRRWQVAPSRGGGSSCGTSHVGRGA
jgi:hypothetical protein